MGRAVVTGAAGTVPETPATRTRTHDTGGALGAAGVAVWIRHTVEHTGETA